MSAQHTPGPWEVEPDLFSDYQTEVCMEARLGHAGTRIANCEHNWNEAEAGERRISWAEAEANARLIAAAPCLLSAAVAAAQVVDCKKYPAQARMLDEAIAKARGAA